jgi:hypothetical protein
MSVSTGARSYDTILHRFDLICEEVEMKFMVHWSIDQENWLPIMKKWGSMTAAERADAGDGVKIVGRWHDTASRTGVAIVETNDAPALQRYLGRWNPSMDLDIAPVLDDEETATLAQALVEDHGV